MFYTIPTKLRIITDDMVDPNKEVVTPIDGVNVHYTVDNVNNEVTIEGVELKEGFSAEDAANAAESAGSVAETMQNLGYDVRFRE